MKLILGILFFLVGPAVFAEESIPINAGEFPPYVSSHLPNKGPHAEAIRKVFAKANIDAQIEIQPWIRTYEEVKKGVKVASFPWLKTEGRVVDLYYPKVPIEVIKDIVVYNKAKFPNGLEVKSLEELVAKKVRIVGIDSYWYSSKLKELNANYEMVATPAIAYGLVARGRADVHINTDKVMMIELMEFLTEEQRALVGYSKTAIYEAPVFLAFSRKSPRHKEYADLWDKLAPGVLKDAIVPPKASADR